MRACGDTFGVKMQVVSLALLGKHACDGSQLANATAATLVKRTISHHTHHFFLRLTKFVEKWEANLILHSRNHHIPASGEDGCDLADMMLCVKATLDAVQYQQTKKQSIACSIINIGYVCLVVV